MHKEEWFKTYEMQCKVLNQDLENVLELKNQININMIKTNAINECKIIPMSVWIQKMFFFCYVLWMAKSKASNKSQYLTMHMSFSILLYHVQLITYNLVTCVFEFSVVKMNAENIQNFFIAWNFFRCKNKYFFPSFKLQEPNINIS